MKQQFIATGFFLFSFLLPIRAMAATFSSMYVFGDSLSDSGNVFNATLASTGTGLPPAPYFNGRFSNGPNWVDYLAEDLRLSPVPFTSLALGASPTQGINFAFGGATTGLDNTINSNLPGLRQQIGLFRNGIPINQSADPNALYILWAGANDYLPTLSPTFTPFDTPETTISNLSFALNSLAQLGARNIMVVNLGDLGRLPLTRNTPISESLNALTQAHNNQLQNLSQSLGTDINLIELDVNSLFDRAISNPEEFGFTNVTDACLSNSGVCDRPDEYLFWDIIHPTTATHRRIGELAFDALEADSSTNVPEPASVLGLFAFGVLGAGARLKRRM